MLVPMSAIGPVGSTAVAGMTAAVARLTQSAQAVAGASIDPVTPIVPHKSPPAGLLAFDPNAPEVDLSGQAVEQIRALHQFRANLRVFQAADETTKSLLSLKA